MDELHIFIYNEIGGFGIQAEDIVEKIHSNKNAKSIVVHIDSPGGFVNSGTTIYNAIRSSGKKTTAVIEGFCGSIATRIALACDKVQIAPNAFFMIHFAAAGVDGNKEELSRLVSELNEIDNTLINEYSAKTGLSKDVISEMMRNEKTMSGEEAVRLGFADELINPIKAVAKFDLNKYKMAETNNAPKVEPQEDTEKLFKRLFNKIEDGFKGIMNIVDPKNVLVTTDSGESIFIEVEDGEDFTGKVAYMADEEGNRTDEFAPAGEHTLETGTRITVGEDGVITEVVEMTEEDRLKEENENLKTEVENLKNEKTELTDQVNNLTQVTSELKNSFDEIKKLGVAKEFITPKANIKPVEKTGKVTTPENQADKMGSWFHKKVKK